MFFTLFFISFATALPQPTLAELNNEQGWSELKTIKDRTVGTIVVQQKDIQDFPCFRAIGTSPTSIDVFAVVAQDIPSSLYWSSAGLTESIAIAQSESQIDYYQYLSIPFVSDRHWFLRAQITKTESSFTLSWSPLPSGEHAAFVAQKKAQYPKAVEPPINVGEWFFQKEGASTKVQYSICTHPGGSVPKQFRSVGTVKTLPTNVKEMILEGKKRAQ